MAGNECCEYELEKMLANINIIFLTLILLISQLYPNLEQRFAISLLYLTYMGIPFAISLVTSVTIVLFQPPPGVFLRGARFLEYIFFILGVMIILRFVISGLEALHINASDWFTMITVLVIASILVAVVDKYLERVARRKFTKSV